jgi:hypothetical protein
MAKSLSWLSMRRPTFAMAGDQMIGILAAAGSRAWRDRRAVVDTADIVAVLARRRELRCGYRARRRLWTWPRRCEAAAHTPALAAIDHEASAVLREALWIARRRARRSAGEVALRWCSCAHRVVRRALREAADMGVGDAHGAHLILAIVVDPVCCGYHALAEAGPDPRDIQPTVLASAGRDGRVRAPALAQLAALSALSHPPPKAGRPWAGRMLLRRLGASAVAYAIGTEATRQAARCGAAEIGAVHVRPRVRPLRPDRLPARPVLCGVSWRPGGHQRPPHDGLHRGRLAGGPRGRSQSGRRLRSAAYTGRPAAHRQPVRAARDGGWTAGESTSRLAFGEDRRPRQLGRHRAR